MVFCKASGPLALIGCRYQAADSTSVGWANYPDGWLRCYQADFRLNGQHYRIGAERPENTVEIDDFELIKAYQLDCGDTIIYNVYNLLRGDDGWDPLGQRRLSESIGADRPRPTYMAMSHRKIELQTDEEPAVLRATPMRHGGYATDRRVEKSTVKWRMAPGCEKYVALSATEGDSIVVTPRNRTDEMAHFCIEAYTDEGLCGAVEMTVKPAWLPSPKFTSRPKLHISDNEVKVDYALDLHGRPDRSLVTWYRCRDKSGAGAIPVAVSRGGKPERTYPLSVADAGRHIMATVEPQHNRCLPGRPDTVVSSSTITSDDVKNGQKSPISSLFETDFRTFPTTNQPLVLPGFWTVDGYKPADTDEFPWSFDMNKDMWTYGKGFNGAVGYGLLQAQRGARLMYTPVEGRYGDMLLTLDADPTKTAGQGFGSATGQYMDVCVKFDTRTLTGYGLRIIRTVKHAKAVDFLLVSYDHGTVTPLTEPVSAICYRTGCTIRIAATGNRLTAHVETATPLPADSPLARQVDLAADITPNDFGGIAIQHTGTCGESTTMLHRVRIERRMKNEE